MIEKQFDILEKTRKAVLAAINDLTLEQINIIPPGFNNNIAWNFAHLVVTQQILCYRFSALECYVSEESIINYKKGTAPNPHVKMSEKDLQQYKELFVLNIDRLKKDYGQGRFKEYNTYTTSMDITLASVEDAIMFNNMHEGIHLGTIRTLRKLV